MSQQDLRQNRSPSARGQVWLVTLAFAVSAVLLIVYPGRFSSPAEPAPVVAGWVTDSTPVRRPKLRPEIEVGGFTYRCSDCHKLFNSPPETTRSLTQHRHIVLKHGINARCFNCHHLTQRDAYVDDWGREIPADQPQLLCAKCHGPVYRDWLNGAHGRTNGYWDKTKGTVERRKCIECHDPHQPPFPPMKPAPGPNTLRMGDQKYPSGHGGVHNPLHLRSFGTPDEPHPAGGEHR